MLLADAAARGHEIANHGLRDAEMYSYPYDQVDSDIVEWERRTRLALATAPHNVKWPQPGDWKWFRPPKGLMSPILDSVLSDRGYRSLIGDVYSDDTGIVN